MSSDQQENGSPMGDRQEAPAQPEHLNIKVTDNNNEVFFKIKKSTKLEKLMGAFCERQGKALNSVRFLFEGQRVQPTDTPDTVSPHVSRLINKRRRVSSTHPIHAKCTNINSQILARDAGRRHP